MALGITRVSFSRASNNFGSQDNQSRVPLPTSVLLKEVADPPTTSEVAGEERL